MVVSIPSWPGGGHLPRTVEAQMAGTAAAMTERQRARSPSPSPPATASCNACGRTRPRRRDRSAPLSSLAVLPDRIIRHRNHIPGLLGLAPRTAVVQRDPAALFRPVMPVLFLLIEHLPPGALDDRQNAVVMRVAVIE